MLIAGLAGFVWLGLHMQKDGLPADHVYTVCLIKQTTGVACPGCGNTRAMVSALHGDFEKAILFNPIGLLLLIVMVVTPLWIIIDLLSRNQSFYRFYIRTEQFLQKKTVAIPLIILILANWIWNIWKGM